MKNITSIILMSFIFVIGNLYIPSIYAMGNKGGNGNSGNNGNNGNNGQGQGGGKANAGGNNPKAQANKNKNKNKFVSQSRYNKKTEINDKREYRVRKFCKNNKEHCGTNRKQIIRTDKEKLSIAIELIEAINRSRKE